MYVRCTDDKAGIDSARRSIRADDIGFRDDGYRKDLLFRAGPLTDRKVVDVISRRFVPVCATYHLATEGQGQVSQTWREHSVGKSVRLTRDSEIGASEAGSLSVDVEKKASVGTWYQICTAPAAKTLSHPGV